MIRWFATSCALVLLLAASRSTSAAIITWDPVFEIDRFQDIHVPRGGRLVLGIDYSNVTDSDPLPAGGDGRINTVRVERINTPNYTTPVDPRIVLITNFNPPTHDPNFWTTPTGDADLDWLLDGYARRFTIPGSTPGRVEIQGLKSGRQYSIQLIGIADVRPESSGRISELDNGAGVYTGLGLRRGDAHSAQGTFTADSSRRQIILLRSFGGDQVNHPDPGISGLFLFAVPEPASGVLFALALGGLLCRRGR